MKREDFFKLAKSTIPKYIDQGPQYVGRGMVVQLDPNTTTNKMFGACMMIVTEVKDWGIQGYVQSLGANREMGGQAYYRAAWETFAHVGYAEWIVSYEDEETTEPSVPSPDQHSPDSRTEP